MTQLNIVELKGMIHEAGISTQVSPVACVIEGFQSLTSREDDLSADEESLLFEISMLIGQHGFGEMGQQAFDTVAKLIEARGLSAFRAPAPDPEQPTDSAE